MKKSHDKALTKMAGKGNVLKGKNIEGKKHKGAIQRGATGTLDNKAAEARIKKYGSVL